MAAPHPPPARSSPTVNPATSPSQNHDPTNPPIRGIPDQSAQSVLGDPYPLPQKNLPTPEMDAMLPLLLFHDGDTLVYIDPPLENSCRQTRSSSTIPHRMHSEKLISTGSNYLIKLFEPRIQKRIARQRGFNQGLLPAGIKYLLDLTPPILEDDAIILLTEVSCPLGIRTWASQRSLWNLPPSCVGGRDICEPAEEGLQHPNPPSLPMPTSPIEEDGQAPPKHNEQGQTNPDLFGYLDEGVYDTINTEVLSSPAVETPTGVPVEYSPVRHRQGIENVLHALEGLSITLDTPSKLWTFYAIAKVFGVATMPTICGYILSWFYESQNTKFVEIYPEIAYRVACGIKSPELCRHAFLVLVGDEALLHLIRSAQIIPKRNFIENFIHSRINGFLEDTEVQSIEYASKSFAEHLIHQFLQLVGAEMRWFEESPEYQKLLRHRDQCPRDRFEVNKLMNQLKVFVRYGVYSILQRSRDPIRTCNAVPPNHTTSQLSHAFGKEDVLQRLIARGFWYSLLSLDLLSDVDQAAICDRHRDMLHQNISDIGLGLLAFKGHEKAAICYRKRGALEREADAINEKIHLKTNRSAGVPNMEMSLTLNLRSPSTTAEIPGALHSTSDSIPAEELNSHNKPFALRARLADQSLDGEQVHPQPVTASDSTFEDAWSLDGFTESSISITDQATSQNQQAQQSIDPNNINHDPNTFDLTLFLVWANTHIRQVARSLLFPTDRPTVPIESVDTLSCLSESQFKFLPLWAGGNDDGSGGVFSDQDIPNMEAGGFSTPGPAVHTGSEASTEDSFSDLGPSDSQSTVHGASHHATYSHVSCVQSMDSLDEEFNQGAGEAKSEVDLSSFDVPCEEEITVESANEEPDFFMDETNSDGASTVIGHFSDSSDDDIDMVQADDLNDDNEIMSDTRNDGFEMVNGIS